MDEVYVGTVYSRDMIEESIGHLVAGADNVADSLAAAQHALELSQDPDSDRTVQLMHEAHAKLLETIGQLASTPVVLSSITQRLGYPGIDDIDKGNPKDAPRLVPEHQDERYKSYIAKMRTIDFALDSGANAETIPGYLASGGVCHVFVLDSTTLMKLPRVKPYDGEDDPADNSPPLAPDEVRVTYVNPLTIGKNVPGLEQIKTFIDYTKTNKGAVIVEYAGRTLDQMQQREIDNISVAHYEKLIVTFAAMAERRLLPQYSSENITYNETGFTVIDYAIIEDGERVPDGQELADRMITGPLNVLISDIRQNASPMAIRNYLTAYRNRFGEAAANELAAK